ncbi:MAG: histidine phosphatase family protein [Pyrinomonadaceae bacterium]
MKTLFILRHAKSSWNEPALDDFDRPLNDRGRRTAPLMGNLMKSKGFCPSVIVASPALRARETAEIVSESGEFEGDLVFDDRIYDAHPTTLVEVIKDVDRGHDSAMIVGHNPGMEALIHALTGRIEVMPTGALAVIELNADSWVDVVHGGGTLRTVFRPKN